MYCEDRGLGGKGLPSLKKKEISYARRLSMERCGGRGECSKGKWVVRKGQRRGSSPYRGKVREVPPVFMLKGEFAVNEKGTNERGCGRKKINSKMEVTFVCKGKQGGRSPKGEFVLRSHNRWGVP